jgi:hypothetical protein
MHPIAHTQCPFYNRFLKAILTSISVIQKRPQLKREYNTNPTIFNDKKSKLSPTTLKRRNKRITHIYFAGHCLLSSLNRSKVPLIPCTTSNKQ